MPRHRNASGRFAPAAPPVTLRADPALRLTRSGRDARAGRRLTVAIVILEAIGTAAFLAYAIPGLHY